VSALDSSTDPETLLDHRSVAWSRVRRSSYWMYQRFQYSYPGAIRELKQRLMVVPHERYGDQQVCAFDLRVSVPNASTSTLRDAFGNRVFLVYAPEASAEVTFELRLVVERDLTMPLEPRLSAAEAALYQAPTVLTRPNDVLRDVARRLAAIHWEPELLCEALSDWVFHAMHYGAGATTVATSAAEALTIGQGLCQDYAHILLALCHAASIPARYISGHMLGEGGSHAWVEVLLAAPEGGYRALALDPTNRRRTTPAYITIAIGRDYSDVSPTSGSYRAPYTGQLTTSKRAGLTHLEYEEPSASGG
jgi:transglutaminase-like putative cysteine protease